MCLKTNLWRLIAPGEYKRHVRLKEKFLPNKSLNKHGACPAVSLGMQAHLRRGCCWDVHIASSDMISSSWPGSDLEAVRIQPSHWEEEER